MAALRRLAVPLVLSASVILLTGRVAPITGSKGESVADVASFNLPAAYVLISPVSRILDGLTLLSTAQTIAFFVLFVALTIAALVRRKDGRRWKRIGIATAGLIVAIGIVELAVAFLPRPMASIAARDPNVVVVDFHSHTGASHDVRKSVTAENNREWHRSGGFDVAYISDHVTFAGAVAGQKKNPARAGDGTSLLSAVEGRYHKIMSTIILGLTESDSALLNKRGNLLGIPAGREPTSIVALPNRNLDSVTVDSLPHFVAIELIDAAPRGLAQFDREEETIRRIASNLRLVLVTASNNHGYGRTVAAWNLLSIPGWRDVLPESAGELIEAPLRARKLDAVQIVMRTRPRTHDWTLPFTLPVLLYQVLGSLTMPERAVWLVWIWVLALIRYRIPQRRMRRFVGGA